MTGRSILSLFHPHWIVLLVAFITIIITGNTHQTTKQRNHIANKEQKKAAVNTDTPAESQEEKMSSPTTTRDDNATTTTPDIKKIQSNIGGNLLEVTATYEAMQQVESTPTPTPHDESTRPSIPAINEEQLIDQWIAENNLNMYGDPFDSMYIGGTPLFNEATGEYTNRYDYIRTNHPNSPWL